MATKKAKKEEAAPTSATYVAIRRCFDRGRFWKPQREATKEKDYLLVVGSGEKVDEKNFMRVDEIPPAVEVAAPEAKAMSEVRADQFLE